MIRPIELRQLALMPTRRIDIAFEEPVSGLESLTPVQGDVQVVHRGDYLEVEGTADTIVTLQCDRCLRHFNHRLETSFQEVLWLDQPGEVPPLEQEVNPGDLEEHLPADGQLDVIDLVYQHLCLALPFRRLCAEDCAGLSEAPAVSERIDHRWDALARLRQQFSNE